LALINPAYADLVLLAGPMAIASLFLLVRSWILRQRPPKEKLRHLVIDGSNVLHWKNNRNRPVSLPCRTESWSDNVRFG
jgi:hypothetical protein